MPISLLSYDNARTSGKSKSVIQKSNKKDTITIYWVRHGLSCANIRKLTHALVADPDLTYTGYQQLLGTKKFIETHGLTFDLFYCSNLSRTIQSILILLLAVSVSCNLFKKDIYKTDTITCAPIPDNLKKKHLDFKSRNNLGYIVSSPHIRETGLGLDNKPLSSDQLETKYSGLSSIMELSNGRDISLKLLLEDMYKRMSEMDGRNILCVSHHHTIVKMIEKRLTNLKNGALVRATYQVERRGRQIVSIECASAELLYPGGTTSEKDITSHCKYISNKAPIFDLKRLS